MVNRISGVLEWSQLNKARKVSFPGIMRITLFDSKVIIHKDKARLPVLPVRWLARTKCVRSHLELHKAISCSCNNQRNKALSEWKIRVWGRRWTCGSRVLPSSGNGKVSYMRPFWGNTWALSLSRDVHCNPYHVTFVLCTRASLRTFDVMVSTVHSQWFLSNKYPTSSRCTVTFRKSFISENGAVVNVYPHIPLTWFHQTFPVHEVDIEIPQQTPYNLC